jgi:hypothetical protein
MEGFPWIPRHLAEAIKPRNRLHVADQALPHLPIWQRAAERGHVLDHMFGICRRGLAEAILPPWI